MGFTILLIVGLGLLGTVVYVVTTYNTMVQLASTVDKNFQPLDLVLLQRYEEIPKLAAACKTAARQEMELVEKLLPLRDAYRKASNEVEKIRVENEAGSQIAALRPRLEAYPDRTMNAEFVQVRRRILELEAEIAERRDQYNHSVTIYNMYIKSFPQRFLATNLGYQERKLFKVPAASKPVRTP